MAKKKDNGLLAPLRASGVGKKVTRAFGSPRSSGKRGKRSTIVGRTIGSFRNAAGGLESRLRGSPRSDAAKKAARIRKRNAAKHSAGTRKAARRRSKVA